MRDSKGRFLKGFSYSPDTQFKKGQHWRKRKDHWDKSWLEQRYLDDKMSCSEIAEMQGCTEANILYWMKKHNIPRRTIEEVRSIKHWGLSGEKNGMYGVTGEDNPNWKGGLTPERQRIYSSVDWKKARKTVRKRDRNTCQLCGSKQSKDNILHIHHIEPFEIEEKRTDPDNLILLCRDCHCWVHSKENKERRWIG